MHRYSRTHLTDSALVRTLMHRYSRTHLSDSALVRTLMARIATDRATTAELLADLGEVDERRLYAPAGYPSMFAFCTGELHLSEETACKRIAAARAARRIPVVFEMVSDGRLHLTAVVLLAPHLSPENAHDLLAAATHRSRLEIEQLLAERFPRLDVPEQVVPLALDSPSPGTVNGAKHACAAASSAPVLAHDTARGIVEPVAPERYAIQFTVSRETREKLVRAQQLLGHDAPSADLAGLFDRALDLLLAQLERRKCAATDRPRAARPSTHPRHVPDAVRRAVWARDGRQCTFVSDSGHRCESRTFLELDHIEPVARGGRATVANLRIRCRAHNQLAADEAFGAGFMNAKRHAAEPPTTTLTPGAHAEGEAAERALIAQAAAREATRHAKTERTIAQAHARASEAARAAAEEMRRRQAAVDEVVPYLRRLGTGAELARQAAAGCECDPVEPLEERIRKALAFYGRLRFPGAKPRSAA